MDETQTRRRAHRWLAVLAAATVAVLAIIGHAAATVTTPWTWVAISAAFTAQWIALARWAVLYVRYRESRRARLWGP